MKRWATVAGLCCCLVLLAGAVAGASAAGAQSATDAGGVGADVPQNWTDIPPGVESGEELPSGNGTIPEPVRLTADTNTTDEEVSTSATPTIQGELLVDRTPGTVGTVEVTYEVTIPDDVVDFYAYLNGSLSQSFSVTGSNGFSYSSSNNRWEASSPQGSTTTVSLTYSVDANRTSGSGYSSVETNDWALVGYGQLGVRQSWRYFNSAPTYEETTTADGQGYGGGNRAFLGPANTRNRSVQGQTVTLVVPDAASSQRSPAKLIDDLAAVSGFLEVGDRDEAVTAIVAPEPIRGGGRGGGSAFWVQEGSTRTTHIHEYIHTRQAWLDGDLPADTDSTVEWFSEASADYYEGYLAWDLLGIFDATEFYNYASTTFKESEVLQDSDSDASELKNYYKGRRVLTALDIRIRQHTDGNRTLAAVFDGLNAESGSFSYSDLRDEVIALTNQSTGSWLDTYVTTSSAPSIPQDVETAYNPGQTPPTVENVTLVDATDRNGVVNGSDTVEITATVTDVLEIDTVEADATGFGAGSVALTDDGPNSTATDDRFSASVAVDPSAPEGDRSVTVNATDIDGNGGDQRVSAAGSVTVDTTTPSPSGFDATNPEGENVSVTFDSTEPLVDVRVSIGGAESATLDEAEFTASAGSYTAVYEGTSSGDYTATLETAADAAGNDGASGQSDTATVEGAVDRVELSPTADQTITAGDSRSFSAQAYDEFGNLLDETDSNFSWDAGGGSVSGSGLFDETTTGSYNVTAALSGVTSNGTVVTVEPGETSTVELSPAANQTIQSGGTVEFSADAFDGFGNLNESTDSNFSWDAEGGSIAADGAFDETALGTYNVTAGLGDITSVPTRVTVETGNIDRVEVQPATDQTLTAGGQIDFNATAVDSSNTVLDDTDSNFTWDATGGSINETGVFSETTPGTYSVTADRRGITSAPTNVTVEPPGEPDIRPDVEVRVGGTAVGSMLAGTDGDVRVNVTNVGDDAAAFELELAFVAPDGSTIDGFDTVNTSELAAGASETVTFAGVTDGLTLAGFYDVVLSAAGATEQETDADAFAVSVDVDGNGNAAADAPDGPASFDGLFDDVTGSGGFGIADVAALFESLGEPAVENNPEFFRFNDPGATDRVGIADVVALFDRV